MELPELVASRAINLTYGEKEHIDVDLTSQIQPHGVLLVLQQNTLEIIQASENTGPFFGITSESLIGENLSSLFEKNGVKEIENILKQENIKLSNPFPLKLIDKGNCRDDNGKKLAKNFLGSIYKAQEKAIILEIEPKTAKKTVLSLKGYHILNKAIENIKGQSSVSILCQKFVKEIRKITGFDRVMAYRFEPDNSGEVIAEDASENLPSYLGLRYPASDVDPKSREFYLKNCLRIIPDVNYQPVNLIPTNNLLSAPLDLSDSLLRSVSPCHLQYLKNMGVTATMVISLIEDDKLWGLVVCHHFAPKYIDWESRKACQLLGHYMSAELFRQQEKEYQLYQEKVKSIQEQIRADLSRETTCISKVLERNQNSLLDLVGAEGAAIALGEEINPIGETPSQRETQALITWLQNQRKEFFYTDSLVDCYPKAKNFKDKASGILAISIFLSPTSYHLIWFRPEQIHNVNWAGNPAESVSLDEDGTVILSPRSSFELWKEQVRDKSLPWEPVAIEAAQELRNSLLLAALEFSQTALKEAAERAQVANRAKSQFLAKMSHELRTPLNAIIGFTQIMNRFNQLSATQKEHVEIINRSGEHLLGLINDVLDVAKIEAGQLTLKENCFDLHRLIRCIEEMLQLKANQKSLELIVEKDSEVPQYVCGDESKLRQIIINLVNNAIKFTNVGSVRLGVFCPTPVSLTTTDKIEVHFEVQDTGAGIASENFTAIFEPFQQTELGKAAEEGTGLGLSISRQFARLMGGDISVRSELDRGTTFTVSVELALAEEIALLPDRSSKRVVGLEPGQPKYRILIVEDVPENQQLMLKLLDSVGFEVRSAANGLEAIALFSEWEPHLIWMDMRMPVMDGYQATKRIKATPKGKQTSIIALTASVLDREISVVREAGCDDFVRKPFQEHEIFDKMTQYLGVRYIYEDKKEYSKTFSKASETCNDQQLRLQLQQMPKDWIENIYAAALGAREKRIIEFIEEIPVESTCLTGTLTKMVENLDFELIANIVEPYIQT
ncbi:MAG: ATP-binding protein [Prochloraceae cyanobacterium]|nr:ATP-binding protein [Prochloraceae cyanobacterium]